MSSANPMMLVRILLKSRNACGKLPARRQALLGMYPLIEESLIGHVLEDKDYTADGIPLTDRPARDLEDELRGFVDYDFMPDNLWGVSEKIPEVAAGHILHYRSLSHPGQRAKVVLPPLVGEHDSMLPIEEYNALGDMCNHGIER
ncbi:MAG: hypothetical protein ACM3MB_03500 [Acidobacteriota bacterium]